jgi:hypothetical protein
LAKVTVDGVAMTIPEIIEQLKKIVPHENFNWEVFHFKDNIFRVRLTSKQEVQRLKNFGTYKCTYRESCLSFDLWSSMEEPLYMLPEVWVRISGLPSDMRSDYLPYGGRNSFLGKPWMWIWHILARTRCFRPRLDAWIVILFLQTVMYLLGGGFSN